eukprot:TRINITY_DN14648_c0_g1_i2.p1 TRINITY_DN14648_c0_g1~~TRINITY_DN14648_c0_g1_i2.p1  ORF type:complete len:384 (+),score=54.10 TRINITY_DN14648_c0_g1_i2:53-1204(+)
MSSDEFWSNSIEVQSIPGKGKGIVAVNDIKKGDLLIIERAVEVAKGTIDSEKSLILNKLLQNIHVRVMKDDAKRKEIFSLFPSKEINEAEFTRHELPVEDGGDNPILVNELNHLYNIITCNTFMVDDDVADEVYFAMFLRTSRMNHSCSPNCFYHFTNRTVYIRSQRDIKKGEELTISYCNEYQTRVDRQQHLKKNYHFTCNCTRCCDHNNEFDLVCAAVECLNKECTGYITADEAGSLRCPECRSDVDREKFRSLYSEFLRKFKNAPTVVPEGVHPQSAIAVSCYKGIIASFFTRLTGASDKKPTAADKKNAFEASKKALASLQRFQCNSEERLLITMKAANLAGSQEERDAYFAKARQLCAELRGGDENLHTHFPKWAPRQ